jgi:hypothetical protein
MSLRGDILKKRKKWPEDITDVFNTLTITGHYNVIGSASLENIKYNSDYDLNEMIKKLGKGSTVFDKIYSIFKEKFKEAKANSNYFITDFKCGIGKDGEPLRWTYNDMMKGVNNGVTFQEALKMKSTIKLDLIVLVDGIFTEFSENYYFNLGGHTNYYKEEMEPSFNKLSIQKSLDEYLVEDNYWKALKRLFSLMLYDVKGKSNKLLKTVADLIDFFNSDIGLINKARNELDILLLVLEQTFRVPKIKDIFYNITQINNWCREAGLNIDFLFLLRKRSLTQIEKSIRLLRDQLYDIVNDISFKYYTKIKSI